MKRLGFSLILLLGACASPAQDLPDPTRAATVLFFITADCPIANAFAPEIKRIIAEYRGKAAFAIVYTDPTTPEAQIRRHAEDYGWDVRIVRDDVHALARRYGATHTPEAVVLGPDGGRHYRGRIDDRYLAPGQYRFRPTTRELRDAIEAVLSGRAPPVAETAVAGCPIISE